MNAPYTSVVYSFFTRTAKESPIRSKLKMGAPVQALAIACFLVLLAGCAGPISAHTWSRDYGLRKMPNEAPNEATGMKYDQRVDGGTLYKQHCSRCHNGRPLSERSFAQNEVSLAHMRDFSGLTGEEYRKILQYMRRWHGVGPATPDVETTPKRLFFNSPDRQGTLDEEPLVPEDNEETKEKAVAKIRG